MERKRRGTSLRWKNMKANVLSVRIDSGCEVGNEKGYNEQNICPFEFILKQFSCHDVEESRNLSFLAFSSEFHEICS